jgi:hypothetical protein
VQVDGQGSRIRQPVRAFARLGLNEWNKRLALNFDMRGIMMAPVSCDLALSIANKWKARRGRSTVKCETRPWTSYQYRKKEWARKIRDIVRDDMVLRILPGARCWRSRVCDTGSDNTRLRVLHAEQPLRLELSASIPSSRRSSESMSELSYCAKGPE